MPACKLCSQSCVYDVCEQCQQQIAAARSARAVMEARIADLEDKLAFVMNFFRPSFQSPIVGAPPTVMSLLELYEKRKLESAAAEQPQTGLING